MWWATSLALLAQLARGLNEKSKTTTTINHDNNALSSQQELLQNKFNHHHLSDAEAHHKRMQAFWTIGQGFEGTASDWTEYVVWLLGVIGVFVYMTNNARTQAAVELDQLVDQNNARQTDDVHDDGTRETEPDATDRAKAE